MTLVIPFPFSGKWKFGTDSKVSKVRWRTFFTDIAPEDKLKLLWSSADYSSSAIIKTQQMSAC